MAIEDKLASKSTKGNKKLTWGPDNASGIVWAVTYRVYNNKTIVSIKSYEEKKNNKQDEGTKTLNLKIKLDQAKKKKTPNDGKTSFELLSLWPIERSSGMGEKCGVVGES